MSKIAQWYSGLTTTGREIVVGIVGTFFLIVLVTVGSLFMNLANVFHRLPRSSTDGTSTSLPVIDSSSEVKTLQYLQPWLNKWAPNVLEHCIPEDVPVEKCIPSGRAK